MNRAFSNWSPILSYKASSSYSSIENVNCIFSMNLSISSLLKSKADSDGFITISIKSPENRSVSSRLAVVELVVSVSLSLSFIKSINS